MDQATIPAAEALREKAAAIVAGRDYRLDSGSPDQSWMFDLLLEILEWILVPIRWLFELTAGLPSVLRWIIVLGLTVLLVLVVAHILYSISSAVRGAKRRASLGSDDSRRRIDPAELERLANEAAQKSDYITAIRFLFRASVVRVELTEKKSNRPGTTNRELLRRYRKRPELSEALGQLVETIDRKWYGDEACSAEDFAACQLAHGHVCRSLKGDAHVVGA